MMTAMTPHQLVGAIVRAELGRQAMSLAEAAETCRISRSTLASVTAGLPSVSDLSRRSIEGGLGLPVKLLDRIIDADAQRIARMPGLREDLRQWILDELTEMTDTAPPQMRDRK